MGSERYKIWERNGATGIFTLVGGRGNYLLDPDFVNLAWLKEKFSDNGLKGIIIKGSGRHFSAGAEMSALKELVKEESQLLRKMTAGKEILRLIESTPLPVVAEINGACFGGGLEIALSCHVRICSENALFAFPEVNHGIMPGLGGTVSLSRLIGPGKAAQAILSGNIIDAQKALKMNLVDYVVPAKDLGEYTLTYLDKLTRDRDVEVIRSVMESIHNAMHLDTDRALEEETKLFCRLALKDLGG